MFFRLLVVWILAQVSYCSAFGLESSLSVHKRETSSLDHIHGDKTDTKDDVSIIRRSLVSSIAVGFLVSIPTEAHAKSYSQNARNLERLNAGDSSGGSVYDNNPSSSAGRKRRAMTGCKISSVRAEAQIRSEKECNQRVLQGDTTLVLEAMQTLDCRTCPYGVAEHR